jgi:tetratricopeptide (TPR) repeat protein
VWWHEGRGRDALHDRDEDRAGQELRAALALAPQRAESWLLLARLHRRRGELPAAAAALRQAEQYGAAEEQVRRQRWLLWAQAGRLRDAEPHLAELLTDPRGEGPDICEAFVQGYFANLRIEDAQTLLDVWVKDFPQDPQPHAMRGYLLQTLALLPEAVAAYRQALDRDSRPTSTRRRLAEALLEMGQREEAGELLRRCVSETPEDVDTQLTWANYLVTSEEPDRARQVLTELLSRESGCFEARRLLGELELNQGRFVEACRHLDLAARQRSHDVTTRNALGKTLRALGRKGEAEPHIQYVREADPALQRLDQQLRQVVQQPRDAELRYQIGRTLLQYGSPDDGAKWLRTVLELQPDHAGAHAELAAYYEARGDRQQALAPRRAPSGP